MIVGLDHAALLVSAVQAELAQEVHTTLKRFESAGRHAAHQFEDSTFYSVVGFHDVEPEILVHLQQLASIHLRASARRWIDRAFDPSAPRLDGGSMHRRLLFGAVILAVHVQAVYIAIQGQKASRT